MWNSFIEISQSLTGDRLDVETVESVIMLLGTAKIRTPTDALGGILSRCVIAAASRGIDPLPEPAANARHVFENSSGSHVLCAEVINLRMPQHAERVWT